VGHLANHEPPIGFGSGSFFTDMPLVIHDLDGPMSPQPGDPPYQTYTFSRTDGNGDPEPSPYINIDRIAVLTERGLPAADQAGGLCFVIYQFEDQNVKLRLWLSDTKDIPADDAPPHIIIDGDSGGSIKSLQAFATPRIQLTKNVRTYRYSHPMSDLSVVKWEVVNEEGEAITIGSEACEKPEGSACGAAGDDMYYLYVSFNEDEDHDHDDGDGNQ
jgi:hypothetical protein